VSNGQSTPGRVLHRHLNGLPARDTQEGSPYTSLENTACTGTSVPSMVAFSSAGGVPLKLMAPARGSTFLCGWCGCTDVRVDPQRHHPHRCEP
ncbi:unnamed protein product, partial [Staurois parvus]